MHPIVDTIWNFCRDHSAGALTGAVGTFFGASVAFFVERWKTGRAANEAKRSCLIEAQMILCLQGNSLESLRLAYAPFRSLQNRERKIPCISHAFVQLAIDPKKLSFVMDGPEPDLLMRLFVADQSYFNATRMLTLRDELMTKLMTSSKVHDDHDQSGVFTIDPDRVLLKSVETATDAVFESLDHAISENSRMLVELRKHALGLYPDRSFPRFELNPPEANNEINKKG
jgi:hypothetical protein